MISFGTGDIFQIDAEVYVNTGNCEGVMGKGIALGFKWRYPVMFQMYRARCLSAQRLRPGELHVWTAPDGKVIVNFPTKTKWRLPSEYEYIHVGLIALGHWLSQRDRLRVVLPALGCANGGLLWPGVKDMIERNLADLDHDILVLGPHDG